jgi:hypothetical protein
MGSTLSTLGALELAPDRKLRTQRGKVLRRTSTMQRLTPVLTRSITQERIADHHENIRIT